MSVISNVHTLVPFIAGESKPLTEQRLAKVGFKETAKMKKDGIKPLPSVCASVPMLADEEINGNISALLPHIRTMLEGTQDAIIRSLYEGSKGQRKEVRTEEINVQACIAFMAAQEAGSRISAESIAAWFSNGMAKDVSSAIIVDALGYGKDIDSLEDLTPEQLQTVSKHVAVYCEVFQSLAGKNLTRASFGDKQWSRLTQILESVLSEMPEDSFALRLQERMQVIAKAVKVEEMI